MVEIQAVLAVKRSFGNERRRASEPLERGVVRPLGSAAEEHGGVPLRRFSAVG